MNSNQPKKICVKLASTPQRKGPYRTLSALSSSCESGTSNSLNSEQAKPSAVVISGANPRYDKPKNTSSNIIAIASENKEDTLKRQKQGIPLEIIILATFKPMKNFRPIARPEITSQTQNYKPIKSILRNEIGYFRDRLVVGVFQPNNTIPGYNKMMMKNLRLDFILDRARLSNNKDKQQELLVEALVCELCNQLLRDPIEGLKCNKNFGSQGFTAQIENNKKCIGGSVSNHIKTAPRFNHLIEKTQIKGINYERGGMFVGQYGKMDLHENVGQFNMVEGLQCQQHMTARETFQHSKIGTISCQKECEYCGEVIPPKEKDMHKLNCTYRIYQGRAFPQGLFIGAKNELIAHMSHGGFILSQGISGGLSCKLNDKDSHKGTESLNDTIKSMSRMNKDNIFRLESLGKENETLKNTIMQINELIQRKNIRVEQMKKECNDFRINKQKMGGLQYLKMNAEEEIDDKEESSETTIDQTNIQSLPVIDFGDSDKDEESTDKHGSVSLEIEIDPTPKYYGYDINENISDEAQEFTCDNNAVKEFIDSLGSISEAEEKPGKENLSESEFLNLFNELNSQLLEDSDEGSKQVSGSQDSNPEKDDITTENLIKLLYVDEDRSNRKQSSTEPNEKQLQVFDSHVKDIGNRVGFEQLYKEITQGNDVNTQQNSSNEKGKNSAKCPSVVISKPNDGKCKQSTGNLLDEEEKGRGFDSMSKNKKFKKCMTYVARGLDGKIVVCKRCKYQCCSCKYPFGTNCKDQGNSGFQFHGSSCPCLGNQK